MKVSTRLVHRLAGHEPDRRSFLVRAAVVGTAIAANPLHFILRPGTAYAAVCGGGRTCDEGWTVFCCTVNGGANTCPPGSFAAGWWKADGSAFCGGAARYYIDCNRLPSQPSACSCRCHTSTTTCDNRRYCCNVFRYGQCHTEIGGVTPVVCRVITCTPPWNWDPSCGTTERTDNRTVTHTAPCLPAPGAGAIAVKYQDLGLTGSPLGDRRTEERDAFAGGGRYAQFEHGTIHWRADLGAWATWGPVHDRWWATLHGPGGPLGYPTSDPRRVSGGGVDQTFESGSLLWTESTGAHRVYGAILTAYRAAGGPAELGFPLADEEPAPGNARRSRFERAMVHWHADLGAHVTRGPILQRWQALGGDGGRLGLPWEDEHPIAGGRGTVQGFTGGSAIWWSPETGAREVSEPMLDAYKRAGGPDRYGFPVDDTESAGNARIARFERAAIASRSDLGTHTIFGAIYDRWRTLGPGGGQVGLPWQGEQRVGDGRGVVQGFTGGAIYWSPTTGAHEVPQPFLEAYRGEGGPKGSLGYPISGVEIVGIVGLGRRRRIRFEHGSLVFDPSAGRVTRG